MVTGQRQPADGKWPDGLRRIRGQGGGPDFHIVAQFLGSLRHFGGVNRDAAAMRIKLVRDQNQRTGGPVGKAGNKRLHRR